MKRRRYGTRVPLNAPATVQSGSRSLACRVVEVSTTDIAVETEASEALCRFVRINAKLLPGSRPVDLDAIVRRGEKRGRLIRWGAELCSPSPENLALIVACLRELGAAPAASEEPTEAADPGTKAVTALGGANDERLRDLYESALHSLE